MGYCGICGSFYFNWQICGCRDRMQRDASGLIGGFIGIFMFMTMPLIIQISIAITFLSAIFYILSTIFTLILNIFSYITIIIDGILNNFLTYRRTKLLISAIYFGITSLYHKIYYVITDMFNILNKWKIYILILLILVSMIYIYRKDSKRQCLDLRFCKNN